MNNLLSYCGLVDVKINASIKDFHVQMGSETQINVKPSIVYTTQSAIETFSPDERDCYADGEVSMNYLDYYRGFRYQINNCLIDEGIRDIIWNCRCLPQFFEGKDDPTAAFLQVCAGDLFLLCHNTECTCVETMKFKSIFTTI